MENCNTVTIVSLKTADAVIKADRNYWDLDQCHSTPNPRTKMSPRKDLDESASTMTMANNLILITSSN